MKNQKMTCVLTKKIKKYGKQQVSTKNLLFLYSNIVTNDRYILCLPLTTIKNCTMSPQN